YLFYVIYTLSLHDALPISDFHNVLFGEYLLNLEEAFLDVLEVRPTLNFLAAELLAIEKLNIANPDHLILAQNTHRYKKLDRLKRSEEHTSELQSPDHLVCR